MRIFSEGTTKGVVEKTVTYLPRDSSQSEKCHDGRCTGKVSVQPHTIVKQICFPNGNVLFLSLFSISKNWMHNVVWSCAEILPTYKLIILMITGRTARLQLEIYPETGWGVMTCYSYHSEILNLNMLNAYAMKTSLSHVAWCSQVKHTLTREMSLIIWTIHLAFFNFRSE